MIRLMAFLGAAVGAVYADPGAAGWLRGFVLPLLFVVCLAHLFWFQGFVVLALSAVSWYFMDVVAGNWFTAGVLPLLFGVLVFYFLWWLGLSLAAASGAWNEGSEATDGGAGDAD